MGIQHDSKWFNCSFDLRHSNSQSRCHHGRIQTEIAERETVWIAYQTNAFWCILHSLSSRLWSLRMKLLKSPGRKRFISLFISLFISMYFSLCFTLCFTFERDFERLHGPQNETLVRLRGPLNRTMAWPSNDVTRRQNEQNEQNEHDVDCQVGLRCFAWQKSMENAKQNVTFCARLVPSVESFRFF